MVMSDDCACDEEEGEERSVCGCLRIVGAGKTNKAADSREYSLRLQTSPVDPPHRGRELGETRGESRLIRPTFRPRGVAPDKLHYGTVLCIPNKNQVTNPRSYTATVLYSCVILYADIGMDVKNMHDFLIPNRVRYSKRRTRRWFPLLRLRCLMQSSFKAKKMVSSGSLHCSDDDGGRGIEV